MKKKINLGNYKLEISLSRKATYSDDTLLLHSVNRP